MATTKYKVPQPVKVPAGSGGGGYPQTDVKTSGIQVRGGKAQTKGKMARGPMG
jgi:hypothetical protein